MPQIVLLRHGQSLWNMQNRYTGWTDVDLTEKGIEEARLAASLIKAVNFTPDIAYTSLLKRAIRTLWIVMDELDSMWLPVVKDWRLNERHYGSLQGLNKAASAQEFGAEQVFRWRRSYQTRPPALATDDRRHPRFDSRYATIPDDQLPAAESLLDTFLRVQSFWQAVVLPALSSGKQVLLVAHGNSLRALVKHLDGISDLDIAELNIPTGIPLLYSVNSDHEWVKHGYLGDPEHARKAVEALKVQTPSNRSDS